MSAPSLADYIADSARRLVNSEISEHDLDRLEYARRTLKRVSKRARAQLRPGGVTGVAAHLAVAEAKRDADRALAHSEWTATTRLHGADRVLFMARLRHEDATITVHAMTLAGLQHGIASVDLGEPDELRAVA